MSAHFLAKKYSLTLAEASQLAVHPRKADILNAVENWRHAHALPAGCALTRGYLCDIVSGKAASWPKQERDAVASLLEPRS